jgi:hypothetical protein
MRKLTSAVVEQSAGYDGSGQHLQAPPPSTSRSSLGQSVYSGIRLCKAATATAVVAQFAVTAPYERRNPWD